VRGLLGWGLLDLGYRSRTSEKTVSRFETMRGTTRADNVETMRRTLEGAGVAFGEDGRVRLHERAWAQGRK
jgi:hypothetical protein